mmetsp:Transcript_20253/g.60400  ORF Transcript_20253/g.60400 Transcript_20253/m.60400 type:complete len:286 (+) Transcript_20253:828-1685(+)
MSRTCVRPCRGDGVLTAGVVLPHPYIAAMALVAGALPTGRDGVVAGERHRRDARTTRCCMCKKSYPQKTSARPAAAPTAPSGPAAGPARRPPGSDHFVKRRPGACASATLNRAEQPPPPRRPSIRLPRPRRSPWPRPTGTHTPLAHDLYPRAASSSLSHVRWSTRRARASTPTPSRPRLSCPATHLSATARTPRARHARTRGRGRPRPPRRRSPRPHSPSPRWPPYFWFLRSSGPPSPVLQYCSRRPLDRRGTMMHIDRPPPISWKRLRGVLVHFFESQLIVPKQ